MNYLKKQATLVKSMLTVSEVVERYTKAKPIGKRVPCPLHGGTGYNLSYTDSFFKCWVCGASGDIFSFVGDLFHLDFAESVEFLVKEFNLPIALQKPCTPQEGRSLQNKVNILLQEKNRLNDRLKRRERVFSETLSEFAKYDKILCSQNPKSIDEMTPEYVEALQKIDHARYRFEWYKEIADEEEENGTDEDRS